MHDAPLTRRSCGFAIFGECDPAACTRSCFTARAIEINEKYPPAKPMFSTRELAAIFIIAVTAFCFAANAGMGRVEQYHRTEARV